MSEAIIVQAERRLIRVVHVGKFYPPVTGGMERVVVACAWPKGREIACSVRHDGANRERIDGVPSIATCSGVPRSRPRSLGQLSRLEAEIS